MLTGAFRAYRKHWASIYISKKGNEELIIHERDSHIYFILKWSSQEKTKINIDLGSVDNYTAMSQKKEKSMTTNIKNLIMNTWWRYPSSRVMNLSPKHSSTSAYSTKSLHVPLDHHYPSAISQTLHDLVQSTITLTRATPMSVISHRHAFTYPSQQSPPVLDSLP